MTTTPVFKLTPGIQDYAWGKKGPESLAAQFASVSIEGFQIDPAKTYAELWMGTHPTLPSKVYGGHLSHHLKKHDGLLHESIHEKFPESTEGSLPFLFKVLSIGTALSIQAHPDKKLAKKLFESRGDVYKDPNHKPEMAIALTPFLAFLNFLPLPTLLHNLQTVPELSLLIPEPLVSSLSSSLNPDSASTASEPEKHALKAIFNALMTAPDDLVISAISALVARYRSGDVTESERELVDLVYMLNEQYPGDVGILCVFFLNVVELKRGEAAFLSANVPHAYLKGDIIECMATSDNVVRAGLTPKLRDVPTLISMLTYEAGPGSKQLLEPVAFGTADESLLYDPPIEEFSVLKIGSSTKQRAIDGPSMCIVTDGKGKIGWGDKEGLEIKRGEVVFIGAGVEVDWVDVEGLEVFRAFVEAGK
ncbi:mannose-6-phosphate isomerase, partial [Tremellales sp. Uapishka_1]